MTDEKPAEGSPLFDDTQEATGVSPFASDDGATPTDSGTTESSTDPVAGPLDGTDAVDSTESTSPSFETLSPDSGSDAADPSLGSPSEPETTPLGDSTESTAPSDVPGAEVGQTPSTDAGSSPSSETGISTVDGPDIDPAPEEDASDSPEPSTSEGTGIEPTGDGTPTDAPTTDGSDESPDLTPANSAGVGDPTATGTVIGKDGASATENQPTIDGLPDPGVDPGVSLSPTFDGSPTSDPTDEDEVDITPVIVQPADNLPAEPSFAVPPPSRMTMTGRTPNFRGSKEGDIISVQKAEWIGTEALVFNADALEELIGLLTELKDTEIETID